VALEIVSALPETKLIWKTNACGTARSRALLEGLFDVWLAEYKFGNDECARRLSRAENYTAVVRENLVWANEHSELIVRHLLMPGHVDCCWRPIAEWLATLYPAAKVSLRTAFWPSKTRHAELGKFVSTEDTRLAQEITEYYNLHLIQ
jgi:putative pyruvate formate lyase activating enzyme